MGRRVLALLFGLFIALPSFAGNAPWVQVHSPNFTVITDAGEKRGREVALHFEQMRAVFGALFQKVKVTSSQPLYIVAFRNTKEFRSICPIWNGKPEELSGYFVQGNGVTYIALDLSTDYTWNVVFHEYGHFLQNSNSLESPPWFDEGFAEYFSTVKIEGKQFVFGIIPPGDPEILQQYKWLPIDVLFDVRHDSPYYNERNRQTIFYAEAWLAFTHYWFNSPMQKQMIAFLQLGPNVPAAQGIPRAFGMDAKALDKDLHNFYMSGHVGSYRMPMPEGVQNVQMTAAPVDDIDARARVAELKLQIKDRQAEAVQEFETILKEKPDHPIALRGLAYAALQSGDKEKAAGYFRRAAALQSDDPHICYFSAVLLSQLGAQQHPEMLAEMQKNLERAVQLDPSFADAYGFLALTYTWQGKAAEAVPPAEKAVELSPRNEQWAMNLAGFYGNAHRFDDATKIWQRLMKSSDPAVAEQASMMANQILQYQQQVAKYDEWRKQEEQSGRMIASTSPQPARESKDAKNDDDTGNIDPDDVQEFFRGTLKQVQCSGSQATFTISLGPRSLTLVASDVHEVDFSGKLQFSCGLHDLKVKGFYHDDGKIKEMTALEFEDNAAGI